MPDPIPNAAAPPTLELAHVLFMDIVGYSKLTMDQQREYLRKLQEGVRNTAAFQLAQSEGKLISLPTGDGMALVFFEDPELPVRCAVELSCALSQKHDEIKLRMGIHTGPVYRVADINAARNVAGGGINIAQRVMDCGDAGHILVSHTMAEVLLQLDAWSNSVHDLGELEVKHGVRLHIYALCAESAGSREPPQKVRAATTPPRQLRVLEAAAPKYSAVGKSTEIVSMVRQTESGGLRAYLKDEKDISSISSDDVRERPFELDFRKDCQGGLLPTDICLRLDAPDFEPRSQTKKLEVPPTGDSQPCLFLFGPRVMGDLVVNLELLKDEVVVVSRFIRTRVAAQGAIIEPGRAVVTIPLMVVVRGDTFENDLLGIERTQHIEFGLFGKRYTFQGDQSRPLEAEAMFSVEKKPDAPAPASLRALPEIPVERSRAPAGLSPHPSPLNRMKIAGIVVSLATVLIGVGVWE